MRWLACALAAAAVLAWPPGRRAVRPRPVRGRRRPDPDPGAGLLQVLEAVGAQVRAGAAPSTAWDAAVEVTGAAHLPRSRGEPLAPLLRRHAPHDPVVHAVAAAWALADDVGAPLADVLDQLARGLRADADVDAEVEAALAAPRATARLLAVLPLAGIGIGELIGAAPVRVLVTTPVGRLCGVAGIVLALAGHLWSGRLVAHAEGTA